MGSVFIFDMFGTRNTYWAALSLSFRLISMLMNIIAWGPQVRETRTCFSQFFVMTGDPWRLDSSVAAY